MQERLKNFWNGIVARWNNLQRGQQVRLGVTALVLLITIGITVYITTRPQMRPLFSNRDPDFIFQVESSLASNNIATRLIGPGTGIEVAEKDFARAKIIIAAENISTADGFTYEDALSNSGMGTTESERTENFRRARETDLARNFELFDGVTKARVQLEVPDTANFFRQTQQQATASVILDTIRTIDREQGLAMARFLAASVIGLTLDNIEIVDQNTNVIYSGLRASEGSTASSMDIEARRRQEMTMSIKALVQPLWDEQRVSLNLKINEDSEVVESQMFSPYSDESETGIIITDTTSRSQATNGTTAGIPGMEANDNVNYAMANNNQESSASTNDRTTTYQPNVTTRVIERGRGSIVLEESSASLAVYRYMHYYQERMDEYEVIPEGMTWEQFKYSLDNEEIEIDESFINLLRAGTGIERFEVRGYTVPVYHDSVIEPFQLEQLAMFAILALLILLLAYGLIKRTQPDEIIEVEPELLVEDLLVSEKEAVEEVREMTEAERLKEIELAELNETKRQIDKFVNEKPEAVAQLLRNWLNDEWE